jgi:polysaccharide chain length determinant protein (PEP-CTERM system associated)
MRYETQKAHFTEQLRETWSRRKWLAAAVFVLTAAAGVTVARTLPDVYRASATVLVEEARTDPAASAELDRRLQMISQEILSRARLHEIIQKFALYGELRQRAGAQAAVDRMRRDTRTQFQAASLTGGMGGSVTLAISYRGRDAATVTSVTNALAGLYLEEDRRLRERRASSAVRLLAAQLAELKQTVDAQERDLASFQERHLGELPQQSDANLAALEQLHSQLRAASEERLRALDRRNDLLRRLSALDEGAAGPAPLPAPASRLDKLKQELAELESRFSDRYPDVIRVKGEIAELEIQPAASAPAAAPPAAPAARSTARLQEEVAQVEREVDAFRSDEARLRSGISGYIQRLENAPRRQRAFQELSRDHDTTRDLYDTLRKRYEQAQLEEETESGDASPRFRILDPALVPDYPAAPNRPFLLLVALLGALGAAVAAATLAERLDTSFKSADDVRGFTPVPVLISIPRMVTAGDRRFRRRRLCAAALATVLGVGVVVQASRLLARDNEALVSMLARGRS